MSILTIAEAAQLIAAKKLSPVELAKTHLDRIRRLDPQLNAFLMVTEERALADAKAAEARQMSGALRGPARRHPDRPQGHLQHGRHPHDGAFQAAAGQRADARRAHRAKWADAGAVMLGKLSTHEFAFGGPSFDVPWPPARNPWNREHFTAGSSSGTGAAVAAGLIMGGTGSDTGGSIRGPAALCGIAGIKPTYGLCSRVGILPLAYLARSRRADGLDGGGLRAAAAGHGRPRHEDPASVDRPVPDFTAELGKGAKGLRIGVVRHFFETDNRASDATRAGIDAALDFFRKEGAEVRDITLSPACRLLRGRLADHDHRGVRPARAVAARALHGLRRDVPRPRQPGRDAERPRHRAGDAPPPRAVPGDGRGDGGSRHHRQRVRSRPRRRASTTCPNGRTSRSRPSPCRATSRASRHQRLHRLRRGRPAGRPCSSPASRSPSRRCCAPPTPTRRRCPGAPSVRRWRCDLQRRFGFRGLLVSSASNALRRRAEIAVAAVDGGDGIDRAHRRHVECHQQALAQLVAHAAFGHQGEAKARLGQPLLRRQAVDQRDVGVVEPGAHELAGEQVARRNRARCAPAERRSSVRRARP